MIIKKATNKDIKEIGYLLNKFQSIMEYEGDTIEPAYIGGFIKNKNKFIFIAKEQEKIIGVATGHIWGEGNYAEIVDLVIKENYQNKGLGKKFINYCIDYFKSRKLDYF